MHVLQLSELSSLPGAFPDDHILYHYAVQEPFEQNTTGQFFISTTKGARYGDPQDPGRWNSYHTQVRLGGLFKNSATDEWEYIYHDMTVPSAEDFFYNPQHPVGSIPAMPAVPATPDQNWTISTKSTKFDSGVLARDSTSGGGALKIFAGHNVVATNQSEGPIFPVDRTEFRYYVIEPDLADFPGSNWAPTIEVAGVAPLDGVEDGETHQGAIAVNEDGVAYITFTRTGTSNVGWPSLVRARLSSNYTTTLYEQSVQAGPPQTYADTGGTPLDVLGLDYADMQADPVHCGFWAVGAIVDENPGSPLPAQSNARAIWLTEIRPCNMNAEMNGDGTVDELDLALYLEYHAKEDQRADMDRSGTITSADYLKYSDEYAKR